MNSRDYKKIVTFFVSKNKEQHLYLITTEYRQSSQSQQQQTNSQMEDCLLAY
ncbi:MAG: hypothetical protein ACI8RD_013891 [Bacillariaceae sp.]|jgi:hypothetical protein